MFPWAAWGNRILVSGMASQYNNHYTNAANGREDRIRTDMLLPPMQARWNHSSTSRYFFGSNTGVEPVPREPHSLMLAITPKAPYMSIYFVEAPGVEPGSPDWRVYWTRTSSMNLIIYLYGTTQSCCSHHSFQALVSQFPINTQSSFSPVHRPPLPDLHNCQMKLTWLRKMMVG